MKLTELNDTLYEGIGTQLLLNLIPKKVRESIDKFVHKKQYKKAIELFYSIMRDKNRIHKSKHLDLIHAAHAVGITDKKHINDLETLIGVH